MSAAVDALRPLTAGRLLTIRQEIRRETEDELEQALLCNAQVLAEACYLSDERVFSSRQEVLDGMTCREMEGLLYALAQGRSPASASAPAENPNFDSARFRALREGTR